MKKILTPFVPLIAVSFLLAGCSTADVAPKPSVTPVVNIDGVTTPISQKLTNLNGSVNIIDKDRIFAILDAESVSSWTVNYSEQGIVNFEPEVLSYGFYAKPAFTGLQSGTVEVTLVDADNQKTYKFSITVN